MIKKTLNNNLKENIINKDISKLKESLPFCFDKDGNFLINKLNDILKESEVDITKDSYSLNWLGKSYSKLLTNMDTETVLSPDIQHNLKNQNINSSNLYIEGDNLDVLKHLVKSYANEIKMIYIDPPYNTGEEFIYNDKFNFTAIQLSELAGISEEEAKNILDMKHSKSNSHSAWLTFMYPRLWVARNLLSEDGSIFISIDNNEQANLKQLCDIIFGEQNFLSQIVVQTNPRGRTLDKFIAGTHEYVLIYSKSNHINSLYQIPKTKKAISEYKLEDKNGKYRLLELRNRNPVFNRQNRPNLFFPIFACKESSEISLIEDSKFNITVLPLNSKGVEGCWTWGKEKVNGECDLLVSSMSKAGKWRIFRKDYLKGSSLYTKSKSTWLESNMNHENGKEMVRELFGFTPFDFPKSVDYIKKCIITSVKSNENHLVLDFFSGSATTAHAVMDLNSEDSGNRRYIMVNLPEETKKETEAYKNGFENICEIGKERIIRAAKKIKKETNANIDYGFKVFKCKDLNNELLENIDSFNPEFPLNMGTTLNDFGLESVIYTWGLEDGASLSDNIKPIELSEYNGYSLNEDTLYLLHSGINENVIKQLLEKSDNDKDFNFNKIVLFGYNCTTSEIMSLKNNIASKVMAR